MLPMSQPARTAACTGCSPSIIRTMRSRPLALSGHSQHVHSGRPPKGRLKCGTSSLLGQARMDNLLKAHTSAPALVHSCAL